LSGENPIVSLGELSKPATVLIEKISDVVGGLFRPYQIKRLAKAEAEAELIRADGQIRVSDLQRRAFYRWLHEEGRKQHNIEEIARKALPEVKEDSQPGKVEDDWIANFFDKCRLISDAEMQQLWSRVLAGEANLPGSFSKRAVNTLSSLDKLDAALFTELCSLGCVFDKLVPLIYDVFAEVYLKHGIGFNTLSHLASIGLIHFSNQDGFLRLWLPKTTTVSYYGQDVQLTFSGETNNKMDIGKVMLTRTGEELARICGSKPDEAFLKYLLDCWKQRGYIKEDK